MGFQDLGKFRSRYPAIRTTGLLTLSLTGLSPAEHASVTGRNNRTYGTTASGRSGRSPTAESRRSFANHLLTNALRKRPLNHVLPLIAGQNDVEQHGQDDAHHDAVRHKNT
jgi:hypothetical protein